MNYTVSMDKAGRIVIPKPIRDQLATGESTSFTLDLVLGRIELTPDRPAESRESRLVEKDGVWIVKKSGQPFNAAEAVHQDREDRIDSLTPTETR